MGLRERLTAWFGRWGCFSADRGNDWRLLEWRANYDEACAIARYFRWSAERRGKHRFGAQGRTRDARA
jgi:hypothetical protein